MFLRSSCLSILSIAACCLTWSLKAALVSEQQSHKEAATKIEIVNAAQFNLLAPACSPI